MATSSTSSSLASSAAALTAPATFSGVSNYASSLQQVLTRAVGIASLPLQSDEVQLNSMQTTYSDLQGLDSAFSNLQQSISSLQSTLNSNLLTSSVSDSTVSATVGSGATAGTYTISVGSLGSYSTALSDAGTTTVADPTTQGLSDSSTFTSHRRRYNDYDYAGIVRPAGSCRGDQPAGRESGAGDPRECGVDQFARLPPLAPSHKSGHRFHRSYGFFGQRPDLQLHRRIAGQL